MCAPNKPAERQLRVEPEQERRDATAVSSPPAAPNVQAAYRIGRK